MPAYDIQAVQNAAARLLGGMSTYNSVQPVVRDVLHWLPIRERENLKIALLMYKAFNVLP